MKKIVYGTKDDRICTGRYDIDSGECSQDTGSRKMKNSSLLYRLQESNRHWKSVTGQK